MSNPAKRGAFGKRRSMSAISFSSSSHGASVLTGSSRPPASCTLHSNWLSHAAWVRQPARVCFRNSSRVWLRPLFSLIFSTRPCATASWMVTRCSEACCGLSFLASATSFANGVSFEPSTR